MKRILYLAGMLSASVAFAQDFNFEAKADALGLPATSNGSLATALVNGKRAVLMTGNISGGEAATRLYLYNPATKAFEEDTNAVFDGIKFGQGIFVDVDKDGDEDVILIGESTSGEPIFKVYEQNAGAFSLKQTISEGLKYASIDAGDYDVNGTIDILVTGMDATSTAKTLIYNNTAGTFALNTNITNLPLVTDVATPAAGDARFGKFNGDTRLDIVFAGNGHKDLVYFQNSRGRFAKSTFQDFTELFADDVDDTIVNPYENATIVVGDISGNKTYQDFVVLGKRKGENSLAFGNEKQGSKYIFDSWGTEANEMPKMEINNGKNSVILADFNDDKKPEMVVIGAGNYNGEDVNTALFYKNIKEDEFTFFEKNEVLDGVDFGKNGSVLAFDYDGDGDLDLFITGEDASGTTSAKLFENKKITLANNEVATKADVKLYPNPVVNSFFIKGIEKVTQVSVLDMSGRLVKTFASQNEYSISDLAKGNYIVVIKGDNKIQKFTIVKK